MLDAKLDKQKHIQYWQRCLNTLLPTAYTSTDSSRMSLGFFILAALDLLAAPPLPETQRAQIRDWILKCQHPAGGFCGSPNHRFPDAYGEMDPPNLPATYFALLSLSYVGRLEGVRRAACLRWLRRLQRGDGSFGELVSEEGGIKGGSDMRYCFVAMAVRWILRGDGEGEGDGQHIEDVDVEKLVEHLRSGQTYDGGISESSQHEAHAGYTYCAIGSLALIDRLPSSKPEIAPSSESIDLPAITKWLVSRQMEYKEEDSDEEEDEVVPKPILAGVYDEEPPAMNNLSLEESTMVGFSGRCNKRADTCYSFWVSASLAMLGQTEVLDFTPLRRFLFEQTQHRIGGFGKCPGDPPDIYHSYLGLAALATMQEPDLKSFDPILCISKEQREKIERLRREALIERGQA